MTYTPTTFKSLPGLLVMVCGTLLVLAGCGHGNGQGLDSSGNLAAASDLGNQSTGGDTSGGDTGGNAGASGNPNATRDWVQDNVFGGVCSICHTGAGAPFGINWSSQSDTCSNVGRPSTWEPSMMEIDSGNPDVSYVLWKLEGQGPNGEPIKGDQMPQNMAPLPADTIQNMRDWISDGTPGCTAPKSTGNEDAVASGTNASTGVDSRSVADATPGSWKEVWNESLRVCTLCHSINPASPGCSTDFECPPNGVVLTEDNYSGVVDGNTVAPFDLERSTLWQRVTASDHEFRMPLGFAPLIQSQLDVIQQWIEGGAPFCPENQVCQ